MADVASMHAPLLPGWDAKSVRDIAVLRLTTGYILLCISLIGFLGGNWDIQWHAMIGRDRTFTPPHVMILVGIGCTGLVALASILLETIWVKHHRELEQVSTDFLGFLHSSLGSYMVGFGTVCSAIAFPLDTYWHSLYGIDVSLWAPFHIMLYTGGLISLFGILYILLSAAHLLESSRWTSMLAYGGVLLLLGEMLSKLCTLAFPSLGNQGTLQLPFGTVFLFPLLISFFAVIACVLAVRILNWPGSATLTVGAFLLFYLAVKAFVPPAMAALVQAEHQQYLPRATQIGAQIVPLLGQTPLFLLMGIAIDSTIWAGSRRKWSLTVMNWGIMIAAMLSMLIVVSIILLTLNAGRASSTSGILLSIFLALPGALIGSWLGLRIGNEIQRLQR